MKCIRAIATGLAVIGLALVLFAAGVFPVAAAEEKASVETEPAPPKTYFVQVGNFIVPVIRGNQVTRHMALAVSLEVTGNEKKAEIEKVMPRVKDAILRELHKHMSRRRDPDGIKEIIKLKEKLLRISNSLLGDGMVDSILIENTLERKIL
ncbi:MAG: flagellar basal body-associated FliL family protein [Alphaproteobacteria bacterium]|nr:flagellar basal body-associated FliL family protein [Alphaproteobacteria bacterium]